METQREPEDFIDRFLARYPRNDQGGFNRRPEDMDTTELVRWYLDEIASGEANVLQANSTMRFVG